MFLKTVALFCMVSSSLARSYHEIAESKSIQLGEPLYEQVSILKPLRVRRQIYGNLTPAYPGATATLGAKGNVLNNNGHSIVTNGQVSKTFQPTGPTGFGGGVNYQGPKAGVSGNVNHVPHFGTDVGVTGNANVWKSRNGNTRVGATGGFNQHYGGPNGQSRPNFNVGANLRF